MSRFLKSLVALLLVPCLILGPETASAFSAQVSVRPQAAVSSAYYEQQAFAVVALPYHLAYEHLESSWLYRTLTLKPNKPPPPRPIKWERPKIIRRENIAAYWRLHRGPLLFGIAVLVTAWMFPGLIPKSMAFSFVAVAGTMGSPFYAPNTKVSTPILWRGMNIHDLPDALEFRVYDDQPIESYLSLNLRNEKLDDLHYFIQDFLEAFRLLRVNGRMTSIEILQALKAEGWSTHVRDPALLERGLEWLAIKGFPIRQMQGRWIVNGLGRQFFFVMDPPSWPTEIQQHWRGVTNSRPKPSTSQMVGKRIRLLIELMYSQYQLRWRDIFRADLNFSSTPEEVWRWSSGRFDAYDSSVNERAWSFGIGPEWFWRSRSRYAPFESHIRAYLRRPQMRRGERLLELRLRAGLERMEVLQALQTQGLSWNESSLQQFEDGVRDQILNPALWPALGSIVGHNGLLLLTGEEDPRRAFRSNQSKEARRETARLALGYREKGQTAEQRENVRILSEKKRWPESLPSESVLGEKKDVPFPNDLHRIRMGLFSVDQVIPFIVYVIEKWGPELGGILSAIFAKIHYDRTLQRLKAGMPDALFQGGMYRMASFSGGLLSFALGSGLIGMGISLFNHQPPQILDLFSILIGGYGLKELFKMLRFEVLSVVLASLPPEFQGSFANIAGLTTEQLLEIADASSLGAGYLYAVKGFGTGIRYDLGGLPGSGRWWFVSTPYRRTLWPAWNKFVLAQDLLQFDGTGELARVVRIYNGDVSEAMKRHDQRLNRVFGLLVSPSQIKFIMPTEIVSGNLIVRAGPSTYDLEDAGPIEGNLKFRRVRIRRAGEGGRTSSIESLFPPDASSHPQNPKLLEAA